MLNIIVSRLIYQRCSTKSQRSLFLLCQPLIARAVSRASTACVGNFSGLKTPVCGWNIRFTCDSAFMATAAGVLLKEFMPKRSGRSVCRRPSEGLRPGWSRLVFLRLTGRCFRVSSRAPVSSRVIGRSRPAGHESSYLNGPHRFGSSASFSRSSSIDV